MHDCLTHLCMAPARLLPELPMPTPRWLAYAWLISDSHVWLISDPHVHHHCLHHLFMTSTCLIGAWPIYDPGVHGSCLKVPALICSGHLPNLLARLLSDSNLHVCYQTNLYIIRSPMHDAYVTPMSMVHILLACAWLLTDLRYLYTIPV